jgi:MinD superfamily P-loop ATPase
MKIAIASGKGGTGKTTLAVNLASYAAQRAKVLLADLDVEEPNSGIFIAGHLLTEKTIFSMVPVWQQENCLMCGRCTKLCRFNALLQLGEKIIVMPQLCHSCYACSELCPASALPMEGKPLGILRHLKSRDLDFIESKLFIGIEQAVPLISQTLEYMSGNLSDHELELWDSPPGTSCPVITVTNAADFVLLVTEPTPFGLYDLNLTVETMEQLGKPFAVIVNRLGIGNDEVFKYCSKRNISVWTTFPDKRYIAELYSRGELIYPEVPEFRQSLDTILTNLDKIREQL